MAEAKFMEKQKVLKFIQLVPFAEEDRKRWEQDLEANDVSETLLEEMHKKLLEIPSEKFASDWMRVKYSTELTKIIKQWRMSLASKHFRRGR